MAKYKNNEIVRQFGMNPEKPDSFQITNEPLMTNIIQWSEKSIDIHDLIKQLFNTNVRTKLIAILLDLNPDNWIGIAASWNQNNYNGQIRVDTKLVEYLLNNAFGESLTNRPFSIKKLTELELNILQAFLGNIENKMKEHYEIDPKHVYLTDTIYLVWLVESQDGEIGRIAFGLPASFKPKKTASGKPTEIADLNKLANTGIKVPVGFKVGFTKLPLNDIKSLESGDLLIFEDSDTSKLYWHIGEIGIVLPDKDHPVFIKDVDNIQELAKEMINKPKTTDDDPLSSLPLELSAEFQKVLIPLKQVLELRAGGVLPLGSVLDSELTLTAQGKPVARGELVIIGNQFGMRISELLISTQKAFSGSKSTVGLGEFTPEQQPTRSKQESSFADELENLEEN
ncbi:MAG: FliM/FliN family flagellar motor switch protein [Candidatus Melainabacteria bacterium]|nr:FliM/FliN family flagellar motor switch protein [Candidatus Melainabacteria bacterium]MBI3307911.1 FliM/FliN family flagellar motor switch protein [Candidatus Melainabacteria bacterium]